MSKMAFGDKVDMANPIVVKEEQQIKVAKARPKPVYSRVVSVRLTITSGAAPDWVVSPVVASGLWLLGIRLRHGAKSPVGGYHCRCRFFTGTTIPRSASDLLSWDELLPIYDEAGKLTTWRIYDQEISLEWSMNVWLEGASRRFGVWAERDDAGDDRLHVSFEISEGG